MKPIRRALNVLLALLMVVLPFPLAAQETGDLEGTVIDHLGLVLPGVSVELKSEQIGTRATVTDGNGIYRFRAVPPGRYTVSASLAGFTRTESIVVMKAAETTRLTLTLTLAVMREEIIVTGESPVVDSTQSSVGFSYAPTPPRNSATKAAGRRVTFSRLPVLNAKPFPDMFFRNFGVNPTIETDEEAFSTFAATVDTASFTLARSYLGRGTMPDPDAVRVEEFVNFFDYRYEAPQDGAPFAVHAEAFPSPNRQGYHVLHVGLKGRVVESEDRQPATLVFCIDVSGSMDIENRLGLVKRALRLLTNELDARDQVGIVVYGTTARVLLEPVSAADKETILAAVDRLKAEGSTNAQDGIREAYRMVARHLKPHQTNRVVLCSDGVANNGISDADGIFAEVKQEASHGIQITAVGFGMGNYNDVLLERLAQIGHGNYAYVDRIEEARRIFVTQLSGTLQTIAKDVKIQVEFDPKNVVRYRLLGFENRALTKEEFTNDRVDAGNIGAGHAVTALYEVKLRSASAPLGTLRIRYKDPEGSRSRLLARSLAGTVRPSIEKASSPARLSYVAASFAEKLRGSYWVRNVSYQDLLAAFEDLGAGLKERSDVAELQELIAKAERIDKRSDRFESMMPIAEMDFDRVPVLESAR
ncbi:MAG: von Willebrand factor type A domain-containing protein [Thermoanaerobaculia bacterium]